MVSASVFYLRPTLAIQSGGKEAIYNELGAIEEDNSNP